MFEICTNLTNSDALVRLSHNSLPLQFTHSSAICLMSLYLSDPAVDKQRLEGLGNLESLVCKLSKQKDQSAIHLKIIIIITEEC